MKAKHKKDVWFTPVRGSYLPCSWQGWALYVPYVYWLIISMTAIYRNNQSVSDFVINLVPYWVSGTVVMHWIAKAKSS